MEFTSEEGAQKLAHKINAFWRKRGVEANARAINNPSGSEYVRRLCPVVVVSDVAKHPAFRTARIALPEPMAA